MKSGDFSLSRDRAFFGEELSEIQGRTYEMKTFSPHAALLAKELQNGHRAWRDYHGEPFDSAKYELVEGMWDHEHCSVCLFSIQTGHTYWESEGRIIQLCDACYEAFVHLT